MFLEMLRSYQHNSETKFKCNLAIIKNRIIIIISCTWILLLLNIVYVLLLRQQLYTLMKLIKKLYKIFYKLHAKDEKKYRFVIFLKDMPFLYLVQFIFFIPPPSWKSQYPFLNYNS